jgi:hypothetical protein
MNAYATVMPQTKEKTSLAETLARRNACSQKRLLAETLARRNTQQLLLHRNKRQQHRQ